MERDCYHLVVRDKPGLLTHVARFLAGDAQISFEGDLSSCQFPLSIPQIPEAASPLHRATKSPKMDYAVLSLNEQTLRPILDTVLPNNYFMCDIIHIQIAQHSVQQFGSYDNFHPGCIVCYSGVPMEFLTDLQQRGVIKSWGKHSPPTS